MPLNVYLHYFFKALVLDSADLFSKQCSFNVDFSKDATIGKLECAENK